MIKALKAIYESNTYGIINIVVTLWGFGQIAFLIIKLSIGDLKKRDAPKIE